MSMQQSLFSELMDSLREAQSIAERDIYVTITGSRSIKDKQFVYKSLNQFVKEFKLDVDRLFLLSGHANGVDKLAEEWAKDNNIPIKTFIPNWSIGKHAGMLRNTTMVKNADVVVALWDGTSKGTKQCMNEADRLGVRLVVYMKEK